MPRVLIIEDDRAVRDGVRLALRRQGHEVAAAATGEDELEQLRSFRPDAVVLDLMLPGMSGLEVCRRIRAHDQVPIIMATAATTPTSWDWSPEPTTTWSNRSAPAYWTHAYAPCCAAWAARRTTRGHRAPNAHGDLVIDRAGLTVTHQGRPVALGPSELRLLLTLSASAGQVFSRQQLLEAVWEHNYHGDARLVDACVKRLRSKIGEPPGSPRYVHTVRGFGYRFGPR
ncbi:DNA-binding response OmpR family regulator OS=Streptomyces griseomycini OX=66895 GN=FHS37_007298 PE=4 SV=1 [Streptomyces griseomycini]